MQREPYPEWFRQNLPERPGVYLFKDRVGEIIYVGKAKNLRKRVLSYFRPPDELPHKTSLMIHRARGVDVILTTTEQEAFILESNLIKRHLPRYNIVLRDDKQYPCLRLDTREPYPRLSVVRRIKKDGALYFGPFSSAHAVRSTLRLIDGIFQLRKCKGRDLPKRSRPCLNYQLGRCLGACVRDVSISNYWEMVEQVRLFLQGRNRELLGSLKKEMEAASDHLDFEKAGRIRDRIRAVEATIERQHVVSARMEDQDIIGLARDNDLMKLVILFIRGGYLLGSRDYSFKLEGASPSEVTESFLKQYYAREPFIPREILISEPVEDLLAIGEWISHLAGRKVNISLPMKGEKRRLVQLAVTNADGLLTTPQEPQGIQLLELSKSILKLKRLPRTMEGLDISNLQGREAVGVIVSFTEGQPRKAGYRNFRIKNVTGIDDYGMMSELAARRLSKAELPDLFVVDGGKGQLLVVKKAIGDFSLEDPPEVVALAKADEKRGERVDKIYIPDLKDPISLPGDHPVLLLLMRVRDEAHRRAISYHRRLRGKTLKASRLDLIPGIGRERKRGLIQHFGDIQAISRAEVDDLIRVPGISRALAQDIVQFFRQ